MHGVGFSGIDPTGAQLCRCQGPRPLDTATAGRIRGAASAGCVILPLDIRRRKRRQRRYDPRGDTVRWIIFALALAAGTDAFAATALSPERIARDIEADG